MNCRNAKKKIPLLLGKELSGKKEESLKSHIGRCSSCQKELRELKLAMAKMKALFQEEKDMDWDQAEWQALIRQIPSQKIERKTSLLRISPKLAVGYGFAFIILAVLLIFLFRTTIIKPRIVPSIPKEALFQKIEPPSSIPKEGKKKPYQGQVIARPQKPSFSPGQKVLKIPQSKKIERQETLTVTLVSQETGLRIVWIFNKNFEWKENEK